MIIRARLQSLRGMTTLQARADSMLQWTTMPNFDRGRSSDDVRAWPLTENRDRLRTIAFHLSLVVGIVLVSALAWWSYCN